MADRRRSATYHPLNTSTTTDDAFRRRRCRGVSRFGHLHRHSHRIGGANKLMYLPNFATDVVLGYRYMGQWSFQCLECIGKTLFGTWAAGEGGGLNATIKECQSQRQIWKKQFTNIAVD